MDLPGWQALRKELNTLGVEIVTVGLEMAGEEVLRGYIDDAKAEHPSLVDSTHQMDVLFGVTNIPSVVWIDENGMIVRPPQIGMPPPVPRPGPEGTLAPYGGAAASPDPEWYARRLRDWAHNGSRSRYALAADEVIALSKPRSLDTSRAAAHFELAQHLWRREGFTSRTFAHFDAAHALHPENITYKRQAYSAYSFGRGDGDELTRFVQDPGEGQEWPFRSSYTPDMRLLRAHLDQ